MLKFAPKNNKQFTIAVRKELKIFVYKIMFFLPGGKAVNVSSRIWKYFLNFHSHFKSYSSLSRSRKTCALTGRSRSIYRGFQFSRMKIRQLAGFGMFYGVQKSS